ncbi:hypothetical protein GOEFS_051_00210 [Gordonia effusa NBRC 100432]|uniref:Uncharacterized protein n=1 Tax=Gordonia effusa NBRC 100432 TaxID=1077974 RepID=H0QZS5_9ACTN|nr:hypothetical protein [Gordonia effusa]GAB18326.1 hypothetical protein GOEFS_051_00210 [Gordonia effusa NBRC 100432]
MTDVAQRLQRALEPFNSDDFACRAVVSVQCTDLLDLLDEYYRLRRDSEQTRSGTVDQTDIAGDGLVGIGDPAEEIARRVWGEEGWPEDVRPEDRREFWLAVAAAREAVKPHPTGLAAVGPADGAADCNGGA